MEAQPQVERDVALDIVRRGALIAPLIVLGAGLLRGWEGAASAAVAVGIVLLNFLAAAVIMSRASQAGPTGIGVAALAGYIIRLAVIVGALFALRNVSWIDMPTLGFVLVGTHIGLLFWEAKYVSLSLAAPGLRPARPGPSGER